MRLLPLRRLLCSLMAERDTSAGVISSSQPHYCWGTLLASPMPTTRRERDLRKQTNMAAVSVSDKRGTVRMKAAGHLLCFLAWGKKENHASAGSRGFCFSHFLAVSLIEAQFSELLLLEEGDDSDVLLEEPLLQELDAEQGLLVLELLHQAEQLGDVGQAELHRSGGAGKVEAEGPGEGAPTTPSSARPTLSRALGSPSAGALSGRRPARARHPRYRSPSGAPLLGGAARRRWASGVAPGWRHRESRRRRTGRRRLRPRHRRMDATESVGPRPPPAAAASGRRRTGEARPFLFGSSNEDLIQMKQKETEML
ncbi:unnamed protein product [Musa hybrid cultivar]